MKVSINGCDLYHGNALEILPTLGECADVIVHDPPYKLTSGGNTTGAMGGCFSHENYDNSGSIVQCDIDWPDFMHLIYKALRGDAHCYTMSNGRNVEDMLREARLAGFRFHNLLDWNKTTGTPSKQYMRNIEFIGLHFKGAAKTINDPGSMAGVSVPQEDYVSVSDPQNRHATTKPTSLMEFYIKNSSEAGQVVLDPFMGVGSTGVAAVRSGRKFIGIEIEKRWFDQACERISRITERKTLF